VIVQIRKYYKNHTFSSIYVNGDWFCYCLEDAGRPVNVKIPNETCIPEGVYDVGISHSMKFNQEMINLYNQPDFTVQRDGIKFTGIRVHGGNKIDHTSGCPLVAYRADAEKGIIWNSASDDLMKLVEDLKITTWVISS
jgi:hypothetical protein